MKKDLGLYAVAEEYEKGMEKCQVDIDRYAKPETARLDQSKKAKYDEAVKKYDKAEKKRDKVIQKMLDTFKHFIHKSLRHIWNDIIQTKLNTIPWVNLLYGVEETEYELGYSLWAFEVVWKFWMRSFFQEDAAEHTLEYLLYGIKKPRKCRATHICKTCEAIK